MPRIILKAWKDWSLKKTPFYIPLDIYIWLLNIRISRKHYKDRYTFPSRFQRWNLATPIQVPLSPRFRWYTLPNIAPRIGPRPRNYSSFFRLLIPHLLRIFRYLGSYDDVAERAIISSLSCSSGKYDWGTRSGWGVWLFWRGPGSRALIRRIGVGMLCRSNTSPWFGIGALGARDERFQRTLGLHALGPPSDVFECFVDFICIFRLPIFPRYFFGLDLHEFEKY